jgi:hypothetical protein
VREGVDWINLALNIDQWRALVNTAKKKKKLWDALKVVNFIAEQLLAFHGLS